MSQPASLRSYFSDSDLETIRRATAEAERRTGGEIVTVIVGRAGLYEATLWKSVCVGALVGVAGAVALAARQAWWVGDPLLWVAVPPVAGGLATFGLLSAWPALRRRLIGAEQRARVSRRRAQVAFLEEAVFETRERTGILLFVAMFEHCVHIIADAGIAAKVDESVWRDVSDRLAARLREGRGADGIVEAVARCGELLEQHGVARREDDINEKADRPRLYDE